MVFARSCSAPLFVFLFVCLFAVQAHSDGIYRWVDTQGKVHFTDRPPAGSKAEDVQVKINTYDAPSIDNFKPSSVEASLETRANSVVMYSTQWCGVCKKAKAFFQQNNIAFTEHDVENSRKGKRDYARLRASGVPVILVGDKRMNGFSAAGFMNMYRKARKPG